MGVLIAVEITFFLSLLGETMRDFLLNRLCELESWEELFSIEVIGLVLRLIGYCVLYGLLRVFLEREGDFFWGIRVRTVFQVC